MFLKLLVVAFQPLMKVFLPQLRPGRRRDETGQICGRPGHHALLEINHLHGGGDVLGGLEEDVVTPEIPVSDHQEFAVPVRTPTGSGHFEKQKSKNRIGSLPPSMFKIAMRTISI